MRAAILSVWFHQFFAPRHAIGSVWRVVALSVSGLGVWVMLDATAPASITGGAGHVVLAVLAVWIPVALGLFRASAHAGRIERRLLCLLDRDTVTGLPNRAMFMARTRRALPQSGALLLFDIDDFKAFNAVHGHRAGDLCLMALALRVRELTGPADLSGRLDGAVFAVYLPGAPLELARDIGDQISMGLQVIRGDTVLRVTVSVGAVLADGQTPLDCLLRDADRALNRAKQQGRARLVLDGLTQAA